MNDGRMNDMFKQMEDLFEKVDNLTSEIDTLKKEHKKHIVYGDNLKALAMDLMYESYNSTDATQNIISSITDNSITLAKSTLINWSKEMKEKLMPEVEKIEEELLGAYYAHFDESQIKVDGKAYNEICASDKKYTRMWTMKSKKHEELEKIRKEYEDIIKEWKKEWMADTNNSEYDNERKLLSRMEEDDKEQILYFLKDFKVPSTNNQVETDQRNIKIKQKIGKFRSEEGDGIYAIIRSCINTYKKQGINVYNAFIKIFKGETVIA